jgi:hypothetical protein
MKFILKQPGLKPEVVEQDSIGLSTLQHYVEGTVTCPHVPGLEKIGATLWANDDGLCLDMEPNLALFESGWYEPMLIVGPVLVTGVNQEGDTVGLTDDQVEKAKAILTNAEKLLIKLLGRGAI